MYEIHPQTLRMYEREGLLRPSRSDGNTRMYTDEDLERLEFILNLARDLGVNIAGIAPVLGHLLDADARTKLVWVTRNPRRTYGDGLVQEILDRRRDPRGS